MSKFSEWIKAQTPATVVVSGEDLYALAKKADAEVVELSQDNKLRLVAGSYLITQKRIGGIFVPKFEYNAVPLKDGGFTVGWTSYVAKREELVRYYPYITVYGMDNYQFTQSLLKALEIKTVEVSFPEATVELPVPAWVLSSTDDQWATVYGSTVFASEAEEFLASFIGEFRRNVAAQLAPKPPEPESAGGCWVCGFPLTPEGHCWVNGCI